MTIREYIEKLFNDIPKSIQRDKVKEEVVMNLDEKVYDLVKKGLSEDEAIHKAIEDFGDITDLKDELVDHEYDKQRKISKYGKQLEFSLFSTAFIIILVIFTNLYYTPSFIWFVYPTIGVLWWPLAMYYRWRKAKDL